MRLDQEEIKDFSYYNNTSLKYVAIGEADATTQQVEEVIKKYLGNGRV